MYAETCASVILVVAYGQLLLMGSCGRAQRQVSVGKIVLHSWSAGCEKKWGEKESRERRASISRAARGTGIGGEGGEARGECWRARGLRWRKKRGGGCLPPSVRPLKKTTKEIYHILYLRGVPPQLAGNDIMVHIAAPEGFLPFSFPPRRVFAT